MSMEEQGKCLTYWATTADEFIYLCYMGQHLHVTNGLKTSKHSRDKIDDKQDSLDVEVQHFSAR